MSKLPSLPKPGKLRRPALKHRTPIKATPSAVKSGAVASHIEAVKYDAEKQHLTVTYRGGRDYTYGGVDQEFVDGLHAAESKGRYLSQNGIRRFEIIV